MFTLHSQSPLGRRGTLETGHGSIETPFFMPVATAAAMKGITLDDLHTLGAQLLLSNTYHLHLQPGDEVVRDAGGLHGFMNWNMPILTDSGGFQVYSLRKTRKTSDEGVYFYSHLDGKKLFIGPRESIAIQHNLGADMIMCFDECPPSKASKEEIEKAVDRTLKWAKVCKDEHIKHLEVSMKQDNQKPMPAIAHKATAGITNKPKTLLFGIVQGGLDLELRKKCTEELIAIGFDGYAIGGLAVGESEEDMMRVVEAVTPLLPEDKPRYLMGVGVIEQMKNCIAAGIDMFDCVLPMRIARHGTILLSDGTDIRIQNAEFKNDFSSIDSDSPSELSRRHSRSYLHHLMKAGERYGETIAGMQNLGVTLEAMQKLRSQM